MKAFKTRLLFIVGLLFVAVVGTTVTAVPAQAQEVNQYITMTPSSAEISLKPGESKEGSVAVVNQGSGAFNVALTSAPYYVLPEDVTYDPKFEPLDGTTNAGEWVKLALTEKADIAPNGVVDVRYTITAPASAKPGGYYAVVFAETTPSDAPETGVVPHNRVGQILYITVDGDVQESGELEEGGVVVTAFTIGTEINSSSIIKNTGGKHFKAKYTTTIHSLFGKEVSTDSKDVYVLPQTKREVKSSWDAASLVGIYKVSRSATLPNGTVTLPDVWVMTVQPFMLVIFFGAILIVSALFILKRRKA